MGVAMSMACDMGNICVTTANEEGMPPVKKRHDIPRTPGGIKPFGTVGWVCARYDQESQAEASWPSVRHGGIGS